MATINYKARVGKDGTLILPREAGEKLGVQQGDEVEVVVRTSSDGNSRRTENPLYDIIGIGKGGTPDGAENHDAPLYGKRQA